MLGQGARSRGALLRLRREGWAPCSATTVHTCPCPAPAVGINVTAPDGGEPWQPGTWNLNYTDCTKSLPVRLQKGNHLCPGRLFDACAHMASCA